MSPVLHTLGLWVIHHEKLSHDLQRPFHASWPPSFHPHFLLKYSRIAWGGCHGDHRASWDQACHLPSGPLHSWGLSVKGGNLPLKLCKLSGVSPYPKLSPTPPTLNPFRAPHLHPLVLPCAFLLSLCSSFPLVAPPWNLLSTVPESYPHTPSHLLSLSSHAIQKLNLKKEWHRKSLVSLLQTK